MREQAELYVRPRWPYEEALRWMEAVRDRVIAGGAMAIGVGEHDGEVVTLGRHTPEGEVLAPEALVRRGAAIVRIERGGGATAHGPGQLVCYPIIDLGRLGLDVPGLTSALELAVVDVLEELGIQAAPGEPERGVYVGTAKIASVGFRVTRGVITHGLALNLDNDLSLFDLIATCGRAGRPMTSAAREAGRKFDEREREQVARSLARRVASRVVLELPT